jgi:uncharacterized damage-inducible protein DinB
MKQLVILFLTVFAFTSVAQESVKQELMYEFKRNKVLSLAYAQAMPEGEFGFRPAKGIRTYSAQLLHLAQGTINLTANGTGETRIYAGKNLEKDTSLQSKAEVIRLLTESFDQAIAGIQKLDADQLHEIVEKGPFKVTRLGWLIKATEHFSHHRGQCAIYLRLKEIEPPKYQLF